MPICEGDPWRMQYFEHADCPPGVNIPTEDPDAWEWNPAYRWIYDKVAIAKSQGLEAGPHGTAPPFFPVFSKPIVNLTGMGVDTPRACRSLRGFTRRQCQTYDGSLVAAHPLDLAAELSRKGIDQPAADPGIGPSRIGPLPVVGDRQAKLSRNAL
jgi:hypothetical protein